MEGNGAKLLSVILIFLTANAKAQIFSIGACPRVTPVVPAPALLIARTWFAYSRTPSIQGHGLRCISAVITFNMGFGIEYNARSKIADTRINLNGQGAFVSGPNVGRLSVSFNNNFPFYRSKSQVFTIVGLDGAVNVAGTTVTTAPMFMSIYSCKEVGLAKIESAIIFTTLRVPSRATVAEATNAFVLRNLPVNNLQRTDQTNC